jgi:hypothetical protein
VQVAVARCAATISRPARKSEYRLMVESFGRQRTNSSIKNPKQRDSCKSNVLSTLLLEDDVKAKQEILFSIRMTPTEVKCVPTLIKTLESLDDNFFDIILIDRHLGGWVSPQSCRYLVRRQASDRTDR